jgi:hypothetical protein
LDLVVILARVGWRSPRGGVSGRGVLHAAGRGDRARDEARRTRPFLRIHTESGLKADFWLAGRDPLHEWAFRHAREYTIRELRVRLAPLEYVIVRKLEFYREGGSEKHLRDIRSMLVVSGDQVDRKALADWIVRLGLKASWSQIEV